MTDSVDPLIDAYYALKPMRFGIWDSLNLKRPLRPGHFGEVEIAIRLVASLDADKTNPESMQCLLLEFTGISELRFGEIAMLGGCLLSIDSIKDRQWEGLNYRVWDQEQEEQISFYCREFTAKLADR